MVIDNYTSAYRKIGQNTLKLRVFKHVYINYLENRKNTLQGFCTRKDIGAHI